MDSLQTTGGQADVDPHLKAFWERQDVALAEPARLPRAADGIMVGVLLIIAVVMVVFGGFMAFAAAPVVGM